MAFGLSQVQYTTISRLTLIFSETIDQDAADNIDASNYVIAGDMYVVGNFSILGSSISFDVALGEVGKVYDITLNNLVSSQGEILMGVRRSFFFGMGVITPMLVNTIPGLGALYVISDAALVGPVIPTSNPAFKLGTARGKSVVRSYNELLGAIPESESYKTSMVTTPYRTLETHFLFITEPGIECGLFINDVFMGSRFSNFEGWTGLSVVLPAGDIDIRIGQSFTPTIFTAGLINSRFMTWQAAIADVLGSVDRGITRVKDARTIERVGSDDIEANFGEFLKTERVDNYSLEVYREILQEILQAYRYWSATPEGLTNVVAAFTQIRPILKWMRRDAPRWVLGWQHFMNREMTERPRFAKTTLPSTNLIPIAASDSNETGTASLFFNPTSGIMQYKSVGDFFGAVVDVDGPGTYTLVSGNGVDTLTVRVSSPTPVTSITIPITVTGLSMPRHVTVLNASFKIVDGALMQKSGLVAQLRASSATPSIQLEADPTFYQHLGEYFVASFWVKQSTGSSRDFVVEVSEDGGATWTTGDTVTVPSGAYTRVAHSQSLGTQISVGVRARLRGLNFLSNETFLVEKAALHSPQSGALYLGRGTIPRSRRRRFFGYQLLMFLREPLEIQAFLSLGLQPPLGWGLDPWGSSPFGSPSYGFMRPALDSTAQVGHIRYIVPTHVEVDVFQDSVLADDNSGVVNVRGVVYEADWRAGDAVNMTVVPRVPDRFSHLVPTTTSFRTETIVFNGSGVAQLAQVSLQEADKSRLLRDGVPMPNSTWQYTDATQIELTSLSELDADAEYTFSYTAAMSYESDTIDLGPDFGLFNWYADWYAFTRARLDPVTQPTTQSLQFSPNSLTATLQQRADQSATDAVLYRNNSQSVEPVSTTSWRFIDSSTVKIDSDAFDPTFVYSLQYVSRSFIKVPTATTKVEVRWSTDGVTFSDWLEIDHDAPFGNRLRYWQFRVSVYNVGDLRDYRLRSLVLKGDPLDRTTIRDQV